MIRNLLGIVLNLLLLVLLGGTAYVTLATLAALALGPLGREVAGIPVHTAGDIARAAVAIVAATLIATILGRLSAQLNASD